MSGIWKHILNGFLMILFTCVLVFAYLLGRNAREGIVCKGVSISILDSTENKFITKSTIKHYLDSTYPGHIGTKIMDMDLTMVEELMKQKSAVKTCQAYTQKDSILYIVLTQRNPVLRFQRGDTGFYADMDGRLFSLQENHTSEVPMIDGNIPLSEEDCKTGAVLSAEKQEWVKEMIALTTYLENDPVWKNRIVQIHIDEDNNMIMIPRVGKERFIIGDGTGIQSKLRKIEAYYKSIVPDKGEGYYRSIDLRFDGQIVCTKEEDKEEKSINI